MEARRRRQRHPGDNRWSAGNSSTNQASISVIEPAEPRVERLGARRVPFGFSRALVEGSDAIQSKPEDGWEQHAAIMVGP